MDKIINLKTKTIPDRYVGWVPCISGKLLFQFTSCDTIGPIGYLNANNIESCTTGGHEVRYVATATRVNWKDVGTHQDGIWNVVLLASAPLTSESLVGQVFLVPNQKSIWEQEIEPILRNIPLQIKEKRQFQNEHQSLKVILESAVRDGIAFGAEFSLKENGITSLVPMQPKSKEHSEKIKFLICRQCFYYIKYAFHKDKHHGRSESLTTVHKDLGNQSQLGKLLIGELKSAVVYLNRNCEASEYKSYFSSKGLLSYGHSLAMTCWVEGLFTEKEYKAESAYIHNMRESLEVIGRRVEGELLARSQFNLNFRSIGLFVFAVLAPFVLIFKEAIQKEIGIEGTHGNMFVNAISWCLSDVNHVVLVVIIILVIYFSSKKLHLRYGSLNLALGKVTKLSRKTLDFAVDDMRSAEVWVKYMKVIAGLVFLSLIYRLIKS